MNALLRALARAASRRPGLVLAVLAVLTVVLGAFASDQSTDTELTSFAPDSEIAAAYERVEADFGASGETLQVVVDAGEGGDVLTPAGIRAAIEVEEAIATSDVDLGDDPGAVRSFATPVVAALEAEGIDPTTASPEQVDAAAAAVSTDLAPVLSAGAAPTEGTAAAGLVVVSFPASMTDAEVVDASIALAEQIDAEVDVPGLVVSPFNSAVLGDELERSSQEEMPRLLGLSFLLILVILLFQFRTVSDVALGLLGLVITITWTFGIGVLLGPGYLGLVGPFSQIALIVPVLLVGLGIDYAIHLTSRYREEQAHGQSPGSSASMAVRTVGGALVLATLTTVVGFLTNLVSPLPPIADFGVFVAVGVLSAFVIMTLLVPAARNLLDGRRERRAAARGADGASRASRRAPGSALSNLAGRTAVISERAPRIALGVALAITVAAGVAASQVGTTFSEDDFIPADSEIGQLIDRIETRFGGGLAETTFVVVDGDLDDPAAVAAIDGVGEAAAGIEGIRLTDGSARVEQIVGADGTAALLAIPTVAGQEGARDLAEELRSALVPLEEAGLTVTVTSEPLVLEESLDALTASQTQGMVVTLVAALIILVLYYGVKERKPVLGLITMVPSLAVVAWVLGTMWLLGISFNVLTAMVASIGIGIGVPFGIHVTHRFLEDRRRYDTVDEAIRKTATHTGGAMAGSAATTAAGFGVLVLASLVPMQQFGLIVAITILYSFLAAILVQPACLKLWGEWRARKGDHATVHDHERREADRERAPAGAAAGPSV